MTDDTMIEINIEVGDIELKGELKDTGCAKKVAEMLPIEEEYKSWGDEFYFPIGVDMDLDETAKRRVEVGTIGYWPDGDAMAIFFGPTPASEDDEPIAASDVNILGKAKDADRLKDVSGAKKIRVSKK